MTKELMYHIFEKNNRFFLLDAHNQLFWQLEPNSDSFEIIENLSKFGFFSDSNTQNIDIKKPKQRPITHFVINPSTDCNLNCWYCYSKEYRKKNSKQLDFDDIKNSIDIVLTYNYEIDPTSHLSIFFGFTQEITLDFEMFLKLKKYIEEVNKRQEPRVYLFPPSSNLLNITNEFVNYIDEYGFLIVSLDLENEYQKQAVIDNLRKFKQDVKKHLIVPMKAGIRDVFKIYTEFSFHFDYISLRPARVPINSKFPWNEETIVITKQEISLLFKTLLEKDNEEILNFLLLLGPTDYIGRYIDRIISRTKVIERCPAGRSAFTLAPNLEIYPCSGMIGHPELYVGEIDLVSDEINFLKNSYNTTSENKTCLRCAIRYFCGGSCQDWLFKQTNSTQESINTYECQLNLHIFEEIVHFLFEIKNKQPSVLDEYIRKRNLRNSLNYPLNFDEFSRFFLQQDV